LSLAITKIPNYKLVKENPILLKITIEQVQGVINFLQQRQSLNLWPDCIEFNRRLDITRNQSFLNVNPEFKDYV